MFSILAGIELSIMRHGCPPRPVTGRDGRDFATGVIVFCHCQSFCHCFFSIWPIVRTYLSVKPLGREKEGVEAVNLGEKPFVGQS